MLAYVVLGILAVTTLDQAVSVAGRQVPLSVITLVVLGLFAFRTWLHRKRELLERTELSECEPGEKAVVAPRRSA